MLIDNANTSVPHPSLSLEQLNARLARSNEELQHFAYIASHDLQEPLRQVIAFCELLRDEYRDQLAGDGIAYIDHAVNAATRMKTLVADLLEYSRVETHGRPAVPTSADNALSIALENLAIAIEETGTTIDKSPLPQVAADPGQLVRLFQNLIGNAIKYRSDAPPRVRIRATHDASECVFHVRDNGLGIDPQFHARIFEIFERLHSRDTHAGTGIGLAVCKRIVDRLGGRIWVESAPGQGSDFCFTLPIATPASTVTLTTLSDDSLGLSAVVAMSAL